MMYYVHIILTAFFFYYLNKKLFITDCISVPSGAIRVCDIIYIN